MYLSPGDLLVVLTDGYTEVFSRKKELLGEEPIIDLLKAHYQEPLPHIHKLLIGVTRDWRGLANAFDDMTVLMFRIK